MGVWSAEHITTAHTDKALLFRSLHSSAGGYGQDAAGVAETVTRVVEAGAAGIDVEDGTRPSSELRARLTAARAAADRVDVSLFLNARTHSYLIGLGDPAVRLKNTLERAGRRPTLSALSPTARRAPQGGILPVWVTS
ncbi:isocitrate lyase/phosphoenolpyruvate mutase family protein [Streptomyces gardneri]|uniref:isocitrate lyase/phosphoenolpyruvate mutase family protein n=1 Tax=Streptomyces gardneri TaxID=66892 RepID=UPI00369C05C7